MNDNTADSLSALANQFISNSSGSSRSRRKNRNKKEVVITQTQDHSKPTPTGALPSTNDRVSKMQELRLKRFKEMQSENDKKSENNVPSWSHLSNMESAIGNLKIDAEKAENNIIHSQPTRIELLENNAFSSSTVILKQKTSLNSENIRNQFRNFIVSEEMKINDLKFYFSEYSDNFNDPSPDDKKLSTRKVALFERTEHLSVK